MSINVPSSLEASIEQFASEQKISQDEAVLRLIELGLSTMGRRPGELLIGLLSDDTDLIRRVGMEARQARDQEEIRDLSA